MPRPVDIRTLKRLARITLATRPTSFDCDQWLALVGRYLEVTRAGGELDDDLRRVERHVKGCPECAEELALLEAAIAPSNEQGG